MAVIDTTRIEREFTRHIRAETTTDYRELAKTPDFDIEPMPMDPWLKDSTMLSLPPLSEIQMEMALYAERIYFPETFKVLGWPDMRTVFEMWLAWGKGAGKDYLSRIMLSRGIYLLHCLSSPQAYFGMPGSETIAFTNIATAAPQAKFIFFDPWVEMLKRSRFFSGIMEPYASHILFDKGLLARSGHSSVESQEGQNLIMAVLDEIAGFKTASELSVKLRKQEREPHASAEGVVKMARSSIRSRFPITGKLIGISFTRFKNDMIDQQVKRAALEWEQIGEESDKIGSRAATWEVNPLRQRSDFDNDYRDDPVDARTRYECRPVASPHRFFKNITAVRRAMGIPLGITADEVEKIPVVVTIAVNYVWGPDPDNPHLEDGWQVKFDFSALERHRKPMAIHLDLGISHDLAGLAGTHVEGYVDHVEEFTDAKTGLVVRKVSKRPRMKTDFVIAFEQIRPDPISGLPESDIQVRWIRQLVIELMNNGWVIGVFTADGYQSTDTFQLLEQHGILTELFSLDRKTEGYDILKNAIYSGDVTIPFNPLLYSELESLTKMTETKIDHQAGMSKDLADAWAGSVRGAYKMIEEGKVGGENEGWSGMSIDEITGDGMEPTRHTDVDFRVKPQYSQDQESDSDFWTGEGVPWDRK